MTDVQISKELREMIKKLIRYNADESSAERDLSSAQAKLNQAMNNVSLMKVEIVNTLGIDSIPATMFKYESKTYRIIAIDGLVSVEEVNVILDF